MLKQDLLSKDRYKIKSPYEMSPIGIVVHNTWNDASAKDEIAYMKRNNNKVSFHVAVDDKEAIQAIPFNRTAWASGGKNPIGNKKYIHFEICYSKSGGSRFIEAEKRCAREIASLLKERGWGIEVVKTHQYFDPSKPCPHRTLAMGWNRFLNMIKQEMNGGIVTPPPQGQKAYLAKVTCDVLNVRQGPSTKYGVTTKVKKGQVYTIVETKDNWGRLKSGVGWIHLGYTKRV